MNFWYALIIGLIIGWLVELLIDIFYWRKRRICPEDNAMAIQADLDNARAANGKLELSLKDSNGRIQALEADLNGRNGRIAELEAELAAVHAELELLDGESEGWGFGSIFEDGKLKLGNFIAGLKDRFGQFRADLNNKDAEIDGLRADVDAKDIALGNMRAEINTLDDEAKGLGLGSLFAGGGLAISGFLANLRDRFDGDDEPAAKSITLDADVDVNAKDAEIAMLNGRVVDLENRLALCNRSLAESQARDDRHEPRGLSMIWGLNTKANDVLERKGITTYNGLAETSQEDVSDALVYSEKYYPNYDYSGIHGSWVEQSRIAAGDDWNGLYAYQQGKFDLVALRDDLKKIWGVGPKIEQVLNDHGIYLFSQVASVPAERITEILRNAGDRFNMSSGKLHETWPKQARIADLGEWEVLKDFQDGLSWSNVN